jgi:hypothetical protein
MWCVCMYAHNQVQLSTNHPVSLGASADQKRCVYVCAWTCTSLLSMYVSVSVYIYMCISVHIRQGLIAHYSPYGYSKQRIHTMLTHKHCLMNVYAACWLEYKRESAVRRGCVQDRHQHTHATHTQHTTHTHTGRSTKVESTEGNEKTRAGSNSFASPAGVELVCVRSCVRVCSLAWVHAVHALRAR